METILNAKVLTGKKVFSIAFDKEKNILIVQASEKPIENKANKEIVKELKKFFHAEVEIVSGLKSKGKKIKINLPKEEVFEKLSNTN